MKRNLFSAVSALALLPCVAPLQAAEPDGERLETLTIEALPLQDVSAAESVQPAKVVAGEELIKQRDRSLGRSLSSEPGISSADFGIGVGRPVVRGLSGPRVRVQENGLSAADVSTLSVDHAVSIDTLTARQIEVLKGPATLLYGSGAIGGVVNVVTDRIPRSAPTRVGGEIDFSVNDSTVGGAATALSLTGGLGDFAWRLHGDTRQTDDYQADGDQRLDNSATETDTYGAGGSWSGSRGYLGAAVASHASTYGIPGEEAQIDLSQDRIDLAGELYDPFPYFERLKVSAAHTDYLHTEGEAGIPEVFFDNEEAEVRVELNHAPAGGWRGALGLQATDRQFEAFGEEEVFVPPTDTRSAALFAVEEYSFGNGWTMQGGFRAERQEHDAGDGNPDRDHSPLSLSAGLLKRLGEQHSATLNVGRYQRAPAAEELYSFGPHEATQTFERGDLDLDEETALNVDIGLRRDRGRLRWSANAFYTQYEDFVVLRSVDEGLNADGSGTPVADGMADRVNEEGEFEVDGELLLQDYGAFDATFYGAEAEISFDLLTAPHRLTATLQGDYVRGELDDENEDLPRITPGRYGVGLAYEGSHWRASTNVLYVSEQTRTAPLEDETDAFTDLTAFLGYRIPVGEESALIYLRGENLLDEEIIRHSSFLRVAQPGRRLTTGVHAHF